jgi:hypothetical protein
VAGGPDERTIPGLAGAVGSAYRVGNQQLRTCNHGIVEGRFLQRRSDAVYKLKHPKRLFDLSGNLVCVGVIREQI